MKDDLEKARELIETVNSKRFDFPLEENIDKLIDYYAGFIEG